MIETDWELLVIKEGKKCEATWPGATGEDAARRYADAHRGVSVIAFRSPRVSVTPVNLRTIRITNTGVGD